MRQFYSLGYFEFYKFDNEEFKKIFGIVDLILVKGKL